MKVFTTANYFSTLAVLATTLLWGVSIWNGTIKALLLAVWYQKFEDGSPLHTRYTGIIILDFPLSILVAFFYSSTNNSDRAQQLFTFDLLSTLQPAYVWLYLESARGSKKPSSLQNPVIWALLWQVFGAAVILPLYFKRHLHWLSGSENILRPASLASSRAIPVALIGAAVLPTLFAMYPTWGAVNAVNHQRILAAWQLSPIWVCLVQGATIRLFSPNATRHSKVPVTTQTSDDSRAVWWSQASYLLAAAVSFAGHAYVLQTILSSADASINLTRMYLSQFVTGPGPSPYILARGPWLFLQSDAMIIFLSSISWASILADRLLQRQTERHSGTSSSHRLALLLPLFLVIGAVIGPSAVVCLVLCWRESELLRLRSFEALGIRNEAVNDDEISPLNQQSQKITADDATAQVHRRHR